MKVTSGSGRAIVFVRHFKITDAHPVVGAAYAAAPKQVRIERGTIAYTWRDGGWVVKDGYDVSIGGPVLRKDGTPSKNDYRHHPADVYRLNGPADLTEKLTEEYQWLVPIIDLLRPGVDLSILTLNETEVNG